MDVSIFYLRSATQFFKDVLINSGHITFCSVLNLFYVRLFSEF